MLFRVQMPGNARGAFKFDTVALVVIYGQRNQVIASLTRQPCHNHRVEAAG